MKFKKLTALLSAAVLCTAALTACGTSAPAMNDKDTPQPEMTASASQSEAEPAPEPEPIVTRLSFSASGDNLIHNGLYMQANRRAGGNGYDFTALYENIAPFIQGIDINWINQETLVTGELAPSNYPRFCTPAEMGQTLYDAGWRVFAMSNNHSYDMGAAGVAATRRFWASMPGDVVTTGLFAGPDDYSNIPIQEIDGVRIAYLAYTEHTNGLPTPSDSEANVIYTKETDVMQQQIRLARESADLVVVGVHWGVEGTHNTTDAQHILGQQLADWGADIVIGTGPHVVQPIELMTAAESGKTVPVIYSLGNFVSLQSAAPNLIGITLTMDIVKTTQPDETSETIIENVHAVPTVMHYDANYTNGRVYLFRDYTDELAAAHGIRAAYPAFSRTYIEDVLKNNIAPEFLILE